MFVKGKCATKKANDDVMTPLPIAKKIIDMFYTSGSILDPFLGNGSFYDQYPIVIKKWCEIKKGYDFFKEQHHYDWIISNPPYSILEQVLEHSFEIADNIVYLLPLSKIVSSMGRVRQINKFGGIKKMWILSASKCGFPFGFPACAVHIQKDYKGNIEVVIDT